MTNGYSVGGDVVSWCTKCKLELGHTIIAIVDNKPVKVKCNTCNGQHNYRSAPAEQKKSTAKRAGRKRKTPEEIYNEHVTRLSSENVPVARKYRINDNFTVDDLIDHPKFGIGVVMAIVKTNKIETLFKDGPRLLIQNQ
ncbi:MAG: hypothetical protein JSW20_12650 [Nitrospiraceae bacterium]|nr:MAG: hypothetical protein JSW20_12650 [Nitrospiraceae bacterium]